MVVTYSWNSNKYIRTRRNENEETPDCLLHPVTCLPLRSVAIYQNSERGQHILAVGTGIQPPPWVASYGAILLSAGLFQHFALRKGYE